MSMQIKVTSESQGSSMRLKVLILNARHDSNHEKYSDKIKINGLLEVQFHCQFSWFSNMKVLIGVRNILKDCYVRVKVRADTGYSSEKISSKKMSWESIGKISNSLENCDYAKQVTTSIFEFSVSIYAYYAYKFEHMSNEKLYNDTESTDFSLSTAEGSVAIHKAQLAVHSDVFRAMLSREWKETKEGRINMPGVTLQTLQQLKDYMYLGTLPDDDLLPLWSIASCYLIEDLKTRCLLKFPEIMKPENFYSMLEYSIENKMPELTFAIIKATPEKVVWDAEKLSKEKNVIEKTEEA